MARFLALELLLAFVGAAPTTATSAATEKHADGASSVHPSSSYFPGSQILSTEQGSTLNGLAGFGTRHDWTMSYSSFTNSSSSSDVYHEQCDQHNKTLHVVINHVAGVPRVFGAFAVRASPTAFPHLGALSLSGASLISPRCVVRRRARGPGPRAAP